MRHRKGWFKMPGMQDGDRTLEEQMRGLKDALAFAPGRTVCDLGSAEGLISFEFAKAGASSIYGCEIVPEHVEVANRLAEKLPEGVARPKFQVANLDDLVRQERASGEVWQYDIVLALAIFHKLKRPEDAIDFAADAARHMLVVRFPIGTKGSFKDERSGNRLIQVTKRIEGRGLKAVKAVDGPRTEKVVYYQRGV